MEKLARWLFFPIPQGTIWGIALYEVFIYFFSFSMNNKFINNNGVNLLHTQNKKTKVEIQIEELKQQEQAINKEL